MRVPSLTLAAAGAALIAPALPAPATAVPPAERVAARDANAVREGSAAPDGGMAGAARGGHAAPSRGAGRAEDPGRAGTAGRAERTRRAEDPVTAARLLARADRCTRVSRGRYRTDAGRPATIPVCGTRDAVFWKADLDIDCDGRPTARCNRRTDPVFAAATAVLGSDGRRLNAETLPYIVLPAPSRRWDHRAFGVRGGSVAAVVYGDRVRYAVVGDTGPRDLIGEASYATARALGIPPDPRSGGVSSGVTYIVFRDSRISAAEDRAAAVAEGERLARRFLARR
ncbi:glycoside hydrolase family 75 protein [Streptomyces achromogenes]|uniref:glycoside hydrolase family 75 protein n=1 Tax=Streptomyces achromogenes TaxID=67255 RepID=UPI0004CAE445|nr:glycoside hydrolase family 75 protein [Streptomyces achromogenes]MCZ0204583.1 glycoside hydrolase family 75 protein [Streptomyces sp. UMAF16]